MNRLLLALLTIVVGLVVSSCAVGVREPATGITKTSATLNGKVLSTTGGPGSWYIEYGPVGAGTALKTATRAIDFVTNESEPVSEPVDGLEPGTNYSFAVCAEDSENPGEPFCSPDQTFTTDYDPALSFEYDCGTGFPGLEVQLSGMPPNTQFHGKLSAPNGVTNEGDFTTDASGGFDVNAVNPIDGTWTATVEWSGGTVVGTYVVDCDEPPPS
jgi:hypothetical protein